MLGGEAGGVCVETVAVSCAATSERCCVPVVALLAQRAMDHKDRRLC
jgi:hypothetical protein